MMNFLFALIELSLLYVTVPELWSEICTAWLVSPGYRPLCTQIYLDRIIPINHSYRQKTRDTGLPDGEDRIPLRFFVLTQYRRVTDGQTNGRADLP